MLVNLIFIDLKLVSVNIQLLTYNFTRRHISEDMNHTGQNMQAAYNNCVVDYVFHTYPLQGSDTSFILPYSKCIL